ncbi:MAG: hypothetical protein VB137_07475 [Burkholderia sp.]
MGDRFAALEPISQGVREQFGSVEADAGRGLSLRMDHGSQYKSDDFRAQLKSSSGGLRRATPSSLGRRPTASPSVSIGP